ncbi:MAG: type II toxin-antitoxin system HicA family toxin [Candidatus Peregrinibacteria bacterium]|nr:type II toxin-antitoxin system HicA family toxin [Candidatus Peregrinibacteria bacterium]MDZ4244324.1 type II toxin-antitoxin system HicA family toxin [Candidatus Gracilibacteria bacterium]
MPKFKRISGKQMIKFLEGLGFFVVRQKGSHVVLKIQDKHGSYGCVVPLHKELASGTIGSILKQAQISKDQFMSLF